MTMSPQFDHERLEVYRVSLEFCTFVSNMTRIMHVSHRLIRDQLVRSCTSIVLNIAEGNGKRSGQDRIRYLDIARGSSAECAATLDVLVAFGAVKPVDTEQGKALLVRIFSMLTKMMRSLGQEVHEVQEPYCFNNDES